MALSEKGDFNYVIIVIRETKFTLTFPQPLKIITGIIIRQEFRLDVSTNATQSVGSLVAILVFRQQKMAVDNA